MKLSKKTKIFLAGHNGMVGSAILKKLRDNGYKNIIIRNRGFIRSKQNLQIS